MITLMDEARQWFKSAQGHLILETPRTDSFCQYTIAQNSPLIVHNALSDSRYFELPPVSDLGIRFYAGIPVRDLQGKAIGTLCVLDVEHREAGDVLLEPLEDLAKWVQAELQLEGLLESERRMLTEMDELRRKASIDPVTRCWNAETGVELLERLMRELTHDSRKGLGVALFRIKDLDQVNVSLGKEVGDMYLRLVANRIRSYAPDGSILCGSRTSHFMLLWPGMPAQQSREIMEKLLERMCAAPYVVSPQKSLPVAASAGMSVYTGSLKSTRELLDQAAGALKRAEQKGPGQFRQAL